MVSVVVVLTAVFLASLVAEVSTAAALGTRDQAVEGGAGGIGISGPNFYAAQTFTAGLTGVLSEVSIQVSPSKASPSDHLSPLLVQIESVNAEGHPSGDVLATATVTDPPQSYIGDQVLLTLANPPAVKAGTQYAIVASDPSDPHLSQDDWTWSFANPNPYAGGHGMLGDGTNWYDQYAFAGGFQTFVTVEPGNGPASSAQGALSWSAPLQVDHNAPRALASVACPSGSQCTATDDAGQEVTFNLTSPGDAVPVTIDSRGSAISVACPSNTQCTAVDPSGQEITFDPLAPSTVDAVTIISVQAPRTSATLQSIACPSANQCTAVGGDITGVGVDGFETKGQAVTFNPHAPDTPTAVTLDDALLDSVACPSTDQCTAIDAGGQSVTFNPLSPGSTTSSSVDNDGPFGLGPLPPSYSVACPSKTQCTVVDRKGREMTFNPTVPGTSNGTTTDPGHALVSVSCPSTSYCVAVDDSGHDVEGDPNAPGGLMRNLVQDGTALAGVSCTSPSQCVAVGVTGDAFLGISGGAATTIRNLLKQEIIPHGGKVRIVSPIKHRSYVLAFTVPVAGRVTIRWYLMRRAGRHHLERVLVAVGRKEFAVGGASTIDIRLTRAGKRLLRHRRRVRLIANARFEEQDHAVVRAHKQFTLKH